MKIRPLQNQLIIKRAEGEDRSAGGIIIPENAKEKPHRGEVIAVGNGKRLPSGETRAPEVKQGDVVLFGKYSGAEIKIDGETYLVVSEDEVLGVIEQT